VTDATRQEYATRAAIERMWSHAVGIANRALAAHGWDPSSGMYGREDSAPGTGVAVRWGEHCCILTAKHVLEGAQVSDLQFFARPSGSFIYASEIKPKDVLAGVSLNDPSAVMHRCEREDLALISLRDTGALGPYLEFADLKNSCVDPGEGDVVIGLGFPVANAAMFGRRIGSRIEKAVALAPTGFSGAVMAPGVGRYFQRFDSERHYLIPYELASQGKHPKGISGAAVWLQSKESAPVWSPRFSFAGVCTDCYKEGTIEQIVKASVATAFLADVFGS